MPTTTTTTVAPTTTTTSVTPTATVLSRKATIGDYSRLGCYSDAVANRVLSNGPHADFNIQTLNLCATTCAGSAYFGVEYGGECRSTLKIMK